MNQTIQNTKFKITAKLDPSWKTALSEQFESKYFVDLNDYLIDEYKNNVVYPNNGNIYSAFNQTPFNKVKVILLGQDPYHGEDQANGLSFSVKKGIKIPPSLKNMYKEMESDLNLSIPLHGELSSWATQGVLLLNSILSVRKGEALSHQNKGWENFTDAAISTLSEKKENLVFLLWGKNACSKKRLIDIKKHKILEAPHPSPLSAYRGFLGCQHFSKTNNYLISHNISPIDWEIK